MGRPLFLLLAVLLGARLAGAQTVTATSGAINGRVADATGGMLPGATVTISSPALMGTRNTTTDAEGFYRFPAVPPGAYKLTFELSGFSPLAREDIQVRVGFTATINAEMQVSSLEQSVIVTGVSPVVDVQATTVSTTFSAETLKSLPFTGEYWGMLSVTPAVNMTRMDSGGSEAMNPVGNTVYGLSGQGRGLVEGIVVTWSNSQVMYYTDPKAFSELQINTLDVGAEYPAPGVTAQFFSKSGGNQFRGSFYFDDEEGKWSTHNIDAAQLALGVTGGSGVAAIDTNRLALYRNTAADIGGYIIKDRLWWYYAFSHLRVDRRLVNVIGTTQTSKNPTNTGKLTFKATPTTTLIGYYQGTKKQQNPYLSGTARVAAGSAIFQPGSGWLQQWRSGIWKTEVNQIVSKSVFAEARVGSWWSDWKNLAMSDTLRYEDIITGSVSGSAHPWNEERTRPQVLGSVNYFKPGWAGSHDIKIGGELAREGLEEEEFSFRNNVAMLLRTGSPSEVMLFDGPNNNAEGLWHTAAYATDTWRPSNRLTFVLGVRYDRYRSYLPGQKHQPILAGSLAIDFTERPDLVTWNNVAPRLGIVYGLSANGKSALKVNYGTYYYNPSNVVSAALNPNQALWSSRYSWNDINRDSLFEPDEQGSLLQSVGGVASIQVDPNLKNTYATQASAMVEHELIPDFGIRTGFVWVGVRDQRTNVNLNAAGGFTVPITVQDPGPDGRTGTADDGGTLSAYNLAPQYVGLPTKSIAQNVPGTNNYYTWEVSGDKRMSQHWALQASFAHTWNQEVTLDAVWNPNLGINRVDNRDLTRRWQGKVAATFQLPYDVRVSPLMRHQAGVPFGRAFVASLNAGSTTVLAEQVGNERTRNETLFDVRAEKGFQLAGHMRAAGFFDLYNIFNSNVENSVTTSSGGAYLRPLSIVAPRVFKLGVKFDW